MERQRPESLEISDHVEIDAFSATLPGILEMPKNALGVVLLSDGSSKARFNSKNLYLVSLFHNLGFGTLLLDLLVTRENVAYDRQFDTDFLAERVLAATLWLQRRQETSGLGLAYFGQGTAAAAALQASARIPEVKAIVSWGGRPDLVWDYLHRVEAPTLLIVGGKNNKSIIEFNRRALGRLNSLIPNKPHKLLVIPDANERSEEAWVVQRLGELTSAWFTKFLPKIQL